MNIQKELAVRCQPHIYRDRKEPFPIRHIGYTVFREKGRSRSFRDLTLDPAEHGAAFIIEYAVYYDYDIQHMYDLEHAWTAVREDGSLAGCWGTFHGMRLRADRLASFRTEEGCPVLYAEPGKHALLPDPALFCLHEQFPECCGKRPGEGSWSRGCWANGWRPTRPRMNGSAGICGSAMSLRPPWSLSGRTCRRSGSCPGRS